MDFLSQAFRRVAGGSPVSGSATALPAAAGFRAELFSRFPFTEEAKRFFLSEIDLVMHDLTSTQGGGYWWPDQRKVELFTAQYEAAIHEYAHAWWHDLRLVDNHARRMMAATQRLADEHDPRYADMARLGRHYVYGITTQPDPHSPTGYWRGMLVDENDWEMYAGLASGCMADIRLLPSYLRPFYHGLFVELPVGAPAPVTLAPHR